jgi:hypothetical protein
MRRILEQQFRQLLGQQLQRLLEQFQQFEQLQQFLKQLEQLQLRRDLIVLILILVLWWPLELEQLQFLRRHLELVRCRRSVLDPLWREAARRQLRRPERCVRDSVNGADNGPRIRQQQHRD